LSRTRLVLLTSLQHRLLPPALEAGGIDCCAGKTRAAFKTVRVLRPDHEWRWFKRGPLSPAVPGQRCNTAAAPIAAKVLRILVAEDNAVNRRWRPTVGELGYAVVDVAANGLEVIDALKTFGLSRGADGLPEPELDGYEATRRIRQFSSPTK